MAPAGLLFEVWRENVEQETCYFLEGSVVVTPANGEPVQIGKGDLVTLPEGIDCVWEIKEPVRKHYLFG